MMQKGDGSVDTVTASGIEGFIEALIMCIDHKNEKNWTKTNSFPYVANMKIEKSRMLILALHEIWNSGEVKKIPKVYSHQCLIHWPKSWGHKARGHQGVLDSILHTREVFPDWHEEILDMIVTEEIVVSRYLSSGTHQGEYLGFGRTGRKISFEEISIYRIEDNLVSEQWCLGDDIHCISQLK